MFKIPRGRGGWKPPSVIVGSSGSLGDPEAREGSNAAAPGYNGTLTAVGVGTKFEKKNFS